MKKSVFMLVFGLMVLLFSSCSKEDNQNTNSLTETDISSFEIESEIPLELRDNQLSTSLSSDRKLMECLRTLELSQEQIQRIRFVMQQTQRCRSTASINARQELKELTTRTAARRETLKKQLEAGEITAEDFEAKMADLKSFFENQRAKIKETLKTSLLECTQNFRSKIAEILSPDQLEQLQNCIGR